MLRRPASTPRRAAAAVEFAVLSPFLVVLLLGLWEVGRLVEVSQTLNNAAREGARQAATGQLSNAQVQAVVLNYLASAGIPTQNATVTVNDLTSPGADASAAAQMDRLQVTVTVPLSDVRWAALYLVTSPGTQLSGQATWLSLKDQDYPTTVTSPAGY